MAVGCNPNAVNLPSTADSGAADAPATDDAPATPDDAVAFDAPAFDAPDGADDAAVEDGSVDDGGTTADAPDVVVVPTACRSSRECVGNGVCDPVSRVCVQCVSAAQCAGATPVCESNRCVAATACMSSRMCPGRVCDVALGRCVDCVANADCADGSECVRSNCLPLPTPCMSSRMCGATDQVCDTARGRCVDCVVDADCGPTEFCTGERTCSPRVCTPGAMDCVALRLRRTCNANGSGWNEIACSGSSSCLAGQCQPWVCTPGSADCSSLRERRTCNTDGLGYATSACGATESCVSGTCRGWTCTPNASTCASSTAVSICNADGLGTRSSSCPSGASCADGRCSSWVCTPGTASCDPSGARRTCNSDGLGYSPAPCVAPAHAATTSCSGGACSFTCESGWGNCDGASSNGCETDLSASASHCGACARTCSSTSGASSACVAGTCQVTCLPNFGDCDANPSNGCEVSTTSDARNCGACGATCAARPNSVASCTVGRCAYVCLSGFGDCDGDASNGCERSLTTDVAHCGSCGNACPTGANAQATCNAGSCTFACQSGFSNCDGSNANGCEVASATDLTNCGGCGRLCAPANATAVCAAGACSVGTCASGFGNCDASATNGCETNLNTSTSNCGACGTVCPGAGAANTVVTCTATVCGSTCATGFGDCDGLSSNGCESNLATDSRNCGACGTACTGGQTCAARVCAAAAPGSLLAARYGQGLATATNGRVYTYGGYNGNSINSTEMFDPATNAWTSRAPLPTALRWNSGVPLTDGRVLSIGGVNTLGTTVTTVYAYNPTTDTWATLAPLSTARHAAAASTGLDGRVYVFGGRGSSAILTTAEVYDPTTNVWTSIAAPPTARQAAGAVTAADGRIYLLGGSTNTSSTGATTLVEIYTPTTNTWLTGPSLPSVRSYFASGRATDGRIYLAGGYVNSDTIGTAVALTPGAGAAGTYATLPGMNIEHGYVRGTPLIDGRFLVVGGYGSSSNFLTRVEAYSPATNTWR